MSRRDLIKMTDGEVADFLAEAHSATLCSIDANGFPHPTAMWYALLDGFIHFSTYAKSQKVVNLSRNPKAAVLIESGENYSDLRGVTVQGNAEIVPDPQLAGDVLLAIADRYPGLDAGLDPANRELVLRNRAQKRAAIRIIPTNTISWDHRKLASSY